MRRRYHLSVPIQLTGAFTVRHHRKAPSELAKKRTAKIARSGRRFSHGFGWHGQAARAVWRRTGARHGLRSALGRWACLDQGRLAALPRLRAVSPNGRLLSVLWIQFDGKHIRPLPRMRGFSSQSPERYYPMQHLTRRPTTPIVSLQCLPNPARAGAGDPISWGESPHGDGHALPPKPVS